MLPNLNFIKTMLNGLMLKIKAIDNRIEQVDKSVVVSVEKSESKMTKYTDDIVTAAVEPLATRKYVDGKDGYKQDVLSGRLDQMVGFAGNGAACSQDMDFGIMSPNGKIWGFEVSDDGALRMVEKTSNLVGLIDGTITEYVNPHITEITGIAFYEQKNLKRVDLPAVTSISQAAFANCETLEEAYFPSATFICDRAFAGSGLKKACFPRVEKIDYEAFYYCESLVETCFPVVTTLMQNVFINCNSLVTLDFPSLRSASSDAFSNCLALTTLIIRTSDKVCDLVGEGGMFTTYDPIGSGRGYIYVPAKLVDAYKKTNGWRHYASQIRAIEDYPEITGGWC